MRKSENPPAFPFAAEYGHPAACGGMTLRDWFAGHCLGALLNGKIGRSGGHEGAEDAFARTAYRLADAMLAERSKGEA